MPETQVKMLPVLLLFIYLTVQGLSLETRATEIQLFPSNGQEDVNPDTQLRLTFPSPPSIGASGLIRVYDVASNDLVDSLNLSIPNPPSGMDFYFFPIIVRDNTATIYLHNNHLEYNKTYSVTIDPGSENAPSPLSSSHGGGERGGVGAGAGGAV
ncbi:hypothetical protein P171DRAFT_490562 [Karstenula rhodostoma CBS 690.94]|uniref:SbsA Ig-like domain-containing protein n=1 Tax=Karstenula rhodostoma CBS 690.94 TaxID=1392251 RepID=A0A9P4P7X9_9PLEO|nr:hypothetical protein P171DRAFT_490562 [Karstenula rhodostoma CBS 690.94]